jgi:hypothetical protein
MRVLVVPSLFLGVFLLGSAVALAVGPIPGKWKVSDGGQVTQKPPSITNTNAAFIQNNGIDQVLVSSTGTSVTETLVLQPDGVVVQFAMPEGAKKVVISDVHTNGAGASGTLIWGEVTGPEDDDPSDPVGRVDR